jgi:hypothetical protein
MNNTISAEPTDLLLLCDWQEKHGGAVFPTYSSLDFFLRKHRKEMIERGALITRKGRAGTLVAPTFGKIAVEILHREALDNYRNYK